MIRALVLAGGPQLEAMVPWLEYLDGTGEVKAEVLGDPSAIRDLRDIDVLVAHPPEGPLEPEAESRIYDFLQRGGGLLALHCTSLSWSAGSGLRGVLGGVTGRLPMSELVVDVEREDHDITRRLGGSFAVEDSGYLGSPSGAPAEVLLSTTWRSERQPLAYVRSAGAGRVFHFGLGESRQTYCLPSVQGLLYRGLRHAAGRPEPGAVGVGLLGYGAIGAEHVRSVAEVPGLELRAVCDRSEDRVASARRQAPEAVVVSDLDQLLQVPEVDLVVISTPPNTHAQMALRVLESGRHVVVEKPLCLSVAEGERLLAAAAASPGTLTVYQNRRWDPDFLALAAAVRSGKLGEVFHVEAFVGGFEHPCHLWHSDASISGGVIFDWGSHYLDWILQLIPGEVVEVSATRQKLVWHDVSNDDHFQLRMRFASGTDAEFTHSDIAAARKPKWYVLGTRGAALGLWREETLLRPAPAGVVEAPIPVSDLPCELHLLRPGPAGRSHDERLALPPSPPHAFYRNLAGHLLAREPLAVTASSAFRNIAVMEAATRAAREGPQRVRI